MDSSGELLFTVLSSLAQEESRNISENCKWAIRHNFQQGIVRVNTKGFMGYDADKDGNLIVNPEQAKIVRRIFREFEEGWTPNEIAGHLNKEKIKGVKGKVAWNGATIRGICEEMGLKNFGMASVDSALTSRVICGQCGMAYGRKCWTNRQQHFWVCKNRWQKGEETCNNENVKEEALQQAIVIAWNAVVKGRE